MPRFYLHVCTGSDFAEDYEGIDVTDASSAREEAVRGARDIMAAEVQKGGLDLGSFIEVEDADRNHLFTVTFNEVLEVRGAASSSPPNGSRRKQTRSNW